MMREKTHKKVLDKNRMITLYNADCLEKMKDISANSIDLVICDLPFGCLASCNGKHDPTKKPSEGRKIVSLPCKWDVKIDLDAFWKEIRRIRKDDHTPCIHFCTTKFGFELWESNKKEFRYDLVWAKPNAVGFLSANKMPLRSHEMIYVFSKTGAYYNRIDLSGDFPAYGGEAATEGQRCVKSWISCKNKKNKHPTAKPVELYKFLIERYCPEGGTVLDPTFGSCNSGIACKELGRNYIGIEKDKDYFDKAEAIFKN